MGKFKNGKAADKDDVTGEMIKGGGRNGIRERKEGKKRRPIHCIYSLGLEVGRNQKGFWERPIMKEKTEGTSVQRRIC